MIDFEEQDSKQEAHQSDQSYEASELEPGGSGKQGDQQQMGQHREPRRDKSANQAGTDKEHGS